MSEIELEEFRKNRILYLDQNANGVAGDECNEMVNFDLVTMPDGSLELKQVQALILLLCRQCKRHICPLLRGENPLPSRESKPISEKINQGIISDMLEEAQCLVDRKRTTIEDNLFWSNVDKVRKKHQDTTKIRNLHQRKSFLLMHLMPTTH